jgi:uncharacterized membrane protein YhiD involved in acid resistance
MPEWLTESWRNQGEVNAWVLMLRLSLAFALGGAVASIYRWTHPHANGEQEEAPAQSFLATLVLLTIIIAVSTQVIGDNVARAFSLVGALSIVRFRTVVQDTRDTAFVIFAVVIGMAVGAGYWLVALIGLVITGLAAFVMRPRRQQTTKTERVWPVITLAVRLGLGRDPQQTLGGLFDDWLERCDLRTIATARQGSALDLTYDISLSDGRSPADLVKALSQVEGVQHIELRRE